MSRLLFHCNKFLNEIFSLFNSKVFATNCDACQTIHAWVTIDLNVYLKVLLNFANFAATSANDHANFAGIDFDDTGCSADNLETAAATAAAAIAVSWCAAEVVAWWAILAVAAAAVLVRLAASIAASAAIALKAVATAAILAWYITATIVLVCRTSSAAAAATICTVTSWSAVIAVVKTAPSEILLFICPAFTHDDKSCKSVLILQK